MSRRIGLQQEFRNWGRAQEEEAGIEWSCELERGRNSPHGNSQCLLGVGWGQNPVRGKRNPLATHGEGFKGRQNPITFLRLAPSH